MDDLGILLRAISRIPRGVMVTLLERCMLADGDAFIYAGCDKSVSMCNARFANVENFRASRIPGQVSPRCCAGVSLKVISMVA